MIFRAPYCPKEANVKLPSGKEEDILYVCTVKTEIC